MKNGKNSHWTWVKNNEGVLTFYRDDGVEFVVVESDCVMLFKTTHQDFPFEEIPVSNHELDVVMASAAYVVVKCLGTRGNVDALMEVVKKAWYA